MNQITGNDQAGWVSSVSTIRMQKTDSTFVPSFRKYLLSPTMYQIIFRLWGYIGKYEEQYFC